jgi:Mn-containing catalase
LSISVAVVFAGKIEIYAAACHGTNWQSRSIVFISLCVQQYEDIVVEQKARSTYEYLIDLAEDPAVLAPLRFIREREIVHFQQFGGALDIARDYLNQQHYFFMQKNGCNTK